MNFSEEYTDLENRVEQEFITKREKFVEIDFLNANTNFEDFDDYQSALENCPTSYYNHKHSGKEKHIYITKIDSEGIHTVDSDDYTNQICIGLNDLNGLYYKIELLEKIEKFLTDIN